MNCQGGTQTYFPWFDGERPLEIPAEHQAPPVPIKGYFPEEPEAPDEPDTQN